MYVNVTHQINLLTSIVFDRFSKITDRGVLMTYYIYKEITDSFFL